LLHFLAGAEGAHLDERGAPAGDLADVFHAASFEVEQGDDETVGGGKADEEFLNDLAGFKGFLGIGFPGFGGEVLDDFGLGFGEVGVAEFGPDAFAIEFVEAGIDGDA